MKTNQAQIKIPSNWQVRKFDSMFTVRRGGSPRPIENFITNREDGLNWLKIGDIDIGAKYITKTSSKILKEGLSRTTLVKKGDFILSNSMSYGRPYIMNIDACIHDGWLTFQDIKSNILDRDFLYYLLSQSKTQAIFTSISAGSGVQNLKKETVSEVTLPIPPLSEQYRIVSVLETWDKAIEELVKKIEIKKQIKKGLMMDLLSGKKRMSGFIDRWKRVSLGDVAIFKKGKGLPKSVLSRNGKYEAIHYGELFTKYNEYIENILSKTDNNKGMFFSKKNDILMPTSDVTPKGLSTASYINKDGVILGGDILVIRSAGSLNGLFFCYIINLYKKEVIKLVSGSTVFHLYGSDMAKFRLNLPSVKEQESIVGILTIADKEITSLKKKLSIIQEQKKYLLNNLIMGTIRTSESLKNNSKKYGNI